MKRSVRRRGSWAVALCSALVALAPAGEAAAQPVDYATKMTARKLADEALKLFDKGEYEAALQKFELADQLVPAPTLGVRAARCLVKLGRLVEASERYLEVVKMQLPPAAPLQHKKAQAEALDEREKLMPRIPTVLVTLKGPRGDGVEVSLDGKKLPDALLGQEQPIDPGKHKLEAARKDTTVKREVDLKESDKANVELKLPPLPLPPPPPEPPEAKTYRALGWIGISAGAGLFLVGVGNGLAAIAQQSALLEKCPDRRCTPEHHAADSLYDVTRAISTAGLIGGVALGGAGLTLLLLAPKAPAPAAPSAAGGAGEAMAPRADIFITWGGAGVRGIF